MPVVVIAIALCLLPAAPAPAQPADSTSAAIAPVSYWGALPPPADSTRATFHNRGRRAWEWGLIVPYSVVNLPLRWIRYGIGGAVIWADNRHLFRYLRLAKVPKGIVPSAGYNSLEGFAAGLNLYYYVADPSNPLRVRAEYSTNEWQRYTAGLIVNEGGQWELQVGAGYRLRPNLRYFGIGPRTDVSGVSYYKDERTWAGALVRRRLGRRSFVTLGGAFSSIDTRLPDEEWSPSLPEVYPEVVEAPGFDQRSDGWMFRVGVVHNSTRQEGNPGHGSVLGATVGTFKSTNQFDVSFLAYRFEAQKFVPLWHSHRALALRSYFNFLDNTGSIDIPFQRLFINELPDRLRGYNSGRWRDRGITGLTVEYRFPFLADRRDGGFGMDTVLLTDLGQVFADIDEVSTENLALSYGFGWRFYMVPHFLGAVECVWSDEGFEFRLSAKQLFQYSRDVFYSGHEETIIH